MPDNHIHTNHALHSAIQELIFRVCAYELNAARSGLTTGNDKVGTGCVVEVLRLDCGGFREGEVEGGVGLVDVVEWNGETAEWVVGGVGLELVALRAFAIGCGWTILSASAWSIPKR
jgi:hypothetical protein